MLEDRSNSTFRAATITDDNILPTLLECGYHASLRGLLIHNAYAMQTRNGLNSRSACSLATLCKNSAIGALPLRRRPLGAT